MRYQDLSRFRVPPGFRGRPAWLVQLWWLVQATVFRHSPQFMYRWRAWLLRCFGAQVGVGTVIRPTASITYPWKVTIGDYAWIGDHAVLYSLGPIRIGAHAVVSQQVYLCAGDHDHHHTSFDIRGPAICLEAETWVACGAFVGPQVTIGRGTVIAARSTVLQDMPGGMICAGTPCRPKKIREIASEAPSSR